MNYSKIIYRLFFYLFFILFFQNLVYSIGVYDSKGDFTYYTNNEKPNINLNISSPAESITISNSSFSIDGIIKNKIYNEILDAGKSKTFSFNSSYNITKDSINLFELLAYGSDGQKIVPQGNPTKFRVIFDNEKSFIVNSNNEYKIEEGESKIINFNFNEKLLSFKIYINDVESSVDSNSPNSIFEKDFKKDFSINFTSKLNEGKNKIRFEIEDFAKNNNTIEFFVSYKGIPINVKLITRKDDATLKYFYNSSYPVFFEKIIYSTTDTYNLVVETTKEAKCYLSNSRIGWGTFAEVSNGGKETMKDFTSTNNGKKHSISVSANSKIWVACQNPSFLEDIVYLNDVLNIDRDLINLKKDSGSTFSFTKTFPNQELTTTKFNALIETSKRSVCSYKLDGRGKERFISLDDKKHIKANISINDGNHNINFECFDVLGEIILKNQEFNVDSKNGVKIFGDFPLYANSPILDVNFEISENIECKYSKNSNLKNVDFNTLQNLTGSDFSRSFTATGLVNGINSYYIRCDKKGNINVNEIKIIYDLNGPVLSNLKFINNGVVSNVLGSTSKISFKFNVSTLTDIEKYFVEFVTNNGSVFRNITSTQVSMNLNISTFKKLKIFALNINGKKSPIIEKSIRFDLEKPQIDIVKSGDKFKITCIDIGTSCNKIFYGLSKTNIKCKANIATDLNSSININENYYVCIKAFDTVGNMAEKLISFGLDFNNDNEKDNDKEKEIDDEEVLKNETIEDDVSLNESENNLVDDPFAGNDFSNDENKNDSNYILVAAIFMLIAGVSGGGYYAYNKGYLNEQLKKLGIKNLPNKNNISHENNNQIKSTGFKKNENSDVKNLKNKKKVSKSNYDHHLDKLNDFIDEKLNKSNDVFNKFNDGKHKGNVKGYDDTLIHIKKDKASLSKEEFDEFYSSSKNLNLNQSSNIEKESEDFEKFYKNKKDLDKEPKRKKK